VAAAKQEIAGYPNQGCRADTDSRHFGGPDVVLAVGGGIKGNNKNDQTGQQKQFSQEFSPELDPYTKQSGSQIRPLCESCESPLTLYLQ
jgi:hypothetical protein